MEELHLNQSEIAKSRVKSFNHKEEVFIGKKDPNGYPIIAQSNIFYLGYHPVTYVVKENEDYKLFSLKSWIDDTPKLPYLHVTVELNSSHTWYEKLLSMRMEQKKNILDFLSSIAASYKFIVMFNDPVKSMSTEDAIDEFIKNISSFLQ